MQPETLEYESRRPAGQMTWRMEEDGGVVRVIVESEPEVRLPRRRMASWKFNLIGLGVVALAVLVTIALADTAAAGCGLVLFAVFFGIFWLLRWQRDRREAIEMGERTTAVASADGFRLLNEDLLPDGTTRVDWHEPPGGRHSRHLEAYFGPVPPSDLDVWMPAAEVLDVTFAPLGDGQHVAVHGHGRSAGFFLPDHAAAAQRVAGALRQRLMEPDAAC